MATATAKIFHVLPPIFQDCVGDDYGKYDLRFPQQVGDYVYASNGRIIVRMLATPEITAAIPDISPKLFPKTAGELFGPRTNWQAAPVAIPSLDGLKRCGVCQGKGHLPKRLCSCDTMEDDEAPCHGQGIIPAGPCWDCNGTGIFDVRNQWLPLRDDVFLAAFYLRILAEHNASLFLPVVANTHDTTTPPYFTVGDVEGLAMPRAIPEPEKVKATVEAVS